MRQCINGMQASSGGRRVAELRSRDCSSCASCPWPISNQRRLPSEQANLPETKGGNTSRDAPVVVYAATATQRQRRYGAGLGWAGLARCWSRTCTHANPCTCNGHATWVARRDDRRNKCTYIHARLPCMKSYCCLRPFFRCFALNPQRKKPTSSLSKMSSSVWLA